MSKLRQIRYQIRDSHGKYRSQYVRLHVSCCDSYVDHCGGSLSVSCSRSSSARSPPRANRTPTRKWSRARRPMNCGTDFRAAGQNASFTGARSEPYMPQTANTHSSSFYFVTITHNLRNIFTILSKENARIVYHSIHLYLVVCLEPSVCAFCAYTPIRTDARPSSCTRTRRSPPSAHAPSPTRGCAAEKRRGRRGGDARSWR